MVSEFNQQQIERLFQELGAASAQADFELSTGFVIEVPGLHSDNPGVNAILYAAGSLLKEAGHVEEAISPNPEPAPLLITTTLEPSPHSPFPARPDPNTMVKAARRKAALKKVNSSREKSL